MNAEPGTIVDVELSRDEARRYRLPRRFRAAVYTTIVVAAGEKLLVGLAIDGLDPLLWVLPQRLREVAG